MGSSMETWSDLLKELLKEISPHLETCFDRVHFRSVCRSWRSYLPPSSPQLHVKCFLPSFENLPSWTVDGEFCFIEKIPVFLFRFPTQDYVPPPSRPPSFSSSFNWWIFGIREQVYGKMSLRSHIDDLGIRCESPISLNSLNCQIFPLGNEYRFFYPVKNVDFCALVGPLYEAAVLPIDETVGDFAVLVEHSFNNLAVFRTTNMMWAVLKTGHGRCESVVSFKGKFYGIYENGTTVVIEVHSLRLNFFPSIGPVRGHRWLVQSGDELLLVEVSLPIISSEALPDTMKCRVLRLDEDAHEWVQIESLGDRVLLISWFWKFCCSAYMLPGFRGNCVIVDCKNDSNAHVFDLEDGSCKTVDTFTGCPRIPHLNLEPAISGRVVARCFGGYGQE